MGEEHLQTSGHDLTIRDARARDVPRIIDIWSAMMAEHEAMDARVRLAPGAVAAYRAYLAHHLSSRDARVFVAETGAGAQDSEKNVAGFGLIILQRNLPMFLPSYYGYLSDLAVDAPLRGRGIGRALVAAISEWLRGRDVDTIQLQHYNENEPAALFWRRCGFKPYYQRMWLDLK